MAIPFQGEPIESFGKGMAQGQNLIQQLLARRQMEQQAKQFERELGLRQSQENRLLSTEGRLQERSPFELRKLQMQTDPALKAQYFKELEEKLGQMGFGNNFGKQLFAAETGIDPDYQSPLEKIMIARHEAELQRQHGIEDFKEKEQIRSENKRANVNADLPTNSFITQIQQQVQAIDNLLPELEELKVSTSIPIQVGSKFHSPNAQADYEALISGLAERLVAGFGYSSSDTALEEAKNQLKKMPLESEKSYKERIDKLKARLIRTKKQGVDKLKGKSFSDEDIPYTPEEEEMAKRNTELANSIGRPEMADPLGIR